MRQIVLNLTTEDGLYMTCLPMKQGTSHKAHMSHFTCAASAEINMTNRHHAFNQAEYVNI